MPAHLQPCFLLEEVVTAFVIEEHSWIEGKLEDRAMSLVQQNLYAFMSCFLSRACTTRQETFDHFANNYWLYLGWHLDDADYAGEIWKELKSRDKLRCARPVSFHVCAFMSSWASWSSSKKLLSFDSCFRGHCLHSCCSRLYAFHWLERSLATCSYCSVQDLLKSGTYHLHHYGYFLTSSEGFGESSLLCWQLCLQT